MNTTNHTSPSGEDAAPLNGIPATFTHDEGAIARCSYCGRYSLDPKTLSDRQPKCDCGEKHGWSGSFKKPGPNAQWSGAAPSEPQHIGEDAANGATSDTGNAEADRIINRLSSSDPDFDDCIDAVAFIRKLVAEHKGPDGFATWKDAAIAERMRRVKSTPASEALIALFLEAMDFGIGFGPRLSEVGEWREYRADKAKHLAIRAANTYPTAPDGFEVALNALAEYQHNWDTGLPAEYANPERIAMECAVEAVREALNDARAALTAEKVAAEPRLCNLDASPWQCANCYSGSGECTAQPAQTQVALTEIVRQIAALRRYGLEHHASGKGRSSTTLNVPKTLLDQIDALLAAQPVSGQTEGNQ